MFWLGKSIKVETPSSGKKKQSINLSPLEVIILTQLRAREIRNNGDPVGQYGYEMIQELNELFAGTWEAKSGTIYPILSKLEKKKNMIIGTRKKSPLGPVKKVYILEDLGRKTIDWIIRSNFDNDIQFVTNFLTLITPFLLKRDDKEEFDDLYKKLMIVPKRMAHIAKDRIITHIDKEIRKNRLKALHKNLSEILSEIEEEISNKL